MKPLHKQNDTKEKPTSILNSFAQSKEVRKQTDEIARDFRFKILRAMNGEQEAMEKVEEMLEKYEMTFRTTKGSLHIMPICDPELEGPTFTVNVQPENEELIVEEVPAHSGFAMLLWLSGLKRDDPELGDRILQHIEDPEMFVEMYSKRELRTPFGPKLLPESDKKLPTHKDPPPAEKKA